MPIDRDYSQFLASLKSAKFRGLRDAQVHVLNEYSTSFVSASDVAIELPTGAGKTLIALLVAEAWRSEGRKAAILSANKTLARQMEREARELRIPVVLMEGSGTLIPNADKKAYQRAKSVAVMNYWVYFNQKPGIDPADLIVMDDAHLAEHCLHSLYSVEIRRQDHLDPLHLPDHRASKQISRVFSACRCARRRRARNLYYPAVVVHRPG